MGDVVKRLSFEDLSATLTESLAKLRAGQDLSSGGHEGAVDLVSRLTEMAMYVVYTARLCGTPHLAAALCGFLTCSRLVSAQ